MRDEGPEEFLAPLVVPTLPSRFYFRYGQGIEVSRTDSREHLDSVYQQASRPNLMQAAVPETCNVAALSAGMCLFEIQMAHAASLGLLLPRSRELAKPQS